MAKIKVSEKTVAQLRKGTMAGNLAKAKNASPEMKEALVRFYGAKRVNAASGPKSAPSQVKKAMPEATKKVTVPGAAKRAGVTQSSKTPAKKVVVPAAAKRAGTSEASKAKKTTTRPSGTIAGTSTAKGTGNTKRVNKPLFDITKIGGNSQAKLTSKAKSSADLYAKQRKAAQAKKKGMK